MGCDPCGGGLGGGDALLAGFPIALVKLEADEVASGIDTGHGGGAAAHAVVEHGIALVGKGLDEVFANVNWLLCRMLHAPVCIAK